MSSVTGRTPTGKPPASRVVKLRVLLIEDDPEDVQKIKEILVDCDGDTVLFRVEQRGGAACHTGYESCFHRKAEPTGELSIVGEKIFDPEKVYRK